MNLFNVAQAADPVAPPVQEAFDALDNFSKTVGIFNPSIGVQTLAGKLILSAMGIVGSLALVFFIYGGIMWMTAGADPKRLNTAKKTMLWAALGLVVMFLSYIVVKMIIEVVSL
ncbi:hypothetical protein HY932_01795 [Candidatus Falkowbacteria bacterium]|nr:hypothetical protein [Candidatus Falkowbacteria bacterium]